MFSPVVSEALMEHASLTHIDLDRNSIGDEGASALAIPPGCLMLNFWILVQDDSCGMFGF